MFHQEVEIEPHVAERNKHSDAAKAASLAKKQNALNSRVQFRTEEALNAALRAVEYRYAHETNPKAEEDALYKQIKKLEVCLSSALLLFQVTLPGEGGPPANLRRHGMWQLVRHHRCRTPHAGFHRQS